MSLIHDDVTTDFLCDAVLHQPFFEDSFTTDMNGHTPSKNKRTESKQGEQEREKQWASNSHDKMAGFEMMHALSQTFDQLGSVLFAQAGSIPLHNVIWALLL